MSTDVKELEQKIIACRELITLIDIDGVEYAVSTVTGTVFTARTSDKQKVEFTATELAELLTAEEPVSIYTDDELLLSN